MYLIPLSKKYHAIVDKELQDYLSQFRWSYQLGNRSKKPYAKRMVRVNGKNYTLFMHHMVLGRIPAVEVDHINGDTLDNRLINLRFVSASQNQLNGHKRVDNTTGYRGVVKARNGRFLAQIKFKGHWHGLGYFDKADVAGVAYQRARTKIINTNVCPIICGKARPHD